MIDIFLNEIFEYLEDEDYFYIWNKKNKQTFWTNDIPQAVKYADEECKKTGNDLYIPVGSGISPNLIERINSSPDIEYKQYLETEIKKFSGFYLDIDIETPGSSHKKSNLPKTIEDALKILDSCWIKPTLIINSGYGFHCWWLFKEPFEIENEDDFNFIKTRLKAFNNAFAVNAKDLGFEIDHLFDLKRLLRIPGTYNYKNPKDPKEVYFVKKVPENRYEVSDFDDFFNFNFEEPKIQTEKNLRNTYTSKNTKIQAILDELDFGDQELNQDHLLSIKITFGTEFDLVWDKMLDLEKYPSASEYDWALVCFAKQLNWSSQKMLQLMLSFRKRHNLNLKLDNKQYYARTIEFVNSSYDERLKKNSTYTSQKNKTENINHLVSTEKDSQINDKNNLLQKDEDKIKEALSNKLGFKILKFMKYFEDPRPQYVLVLENNKKIVLGEISQVSSQNKFKNHILDAINYCMPSFKKDNWDIILQQLFDVCEEIQTDEENSNRAIIIWLEEYLQEQPNIDCDEGCQTNSSFKENGDWYIFADNFYTWCVSVKSAEFKKNRFLTYLSMHGCISLQVRYTTEHEEQGRKRVWRVPTRIFK